MHELATERFIHTDILNEQVVKERVLGEKQKNLFFTLATVLLVVIFFVLYVWSRLEVINLGYRISHVDKTQKELLRVNRELKLEIASLKSPSRLEKIGKENLNLFPPDPRQIVIMR
jgi:cell division protein FtsL